MDARLVDGSDLNSQYTALSYCWGPATHGRCTTSTSTIRARMSRIEYAFLPKTFRHAFEVTRALGVRYIWIDALCILQDSKRDWEDQSAKMGAIYSSSVFTIAADCSSDADGGCFRQTVSSSSNALANAFRITSTLSDERRSSILLCPLEDDLESNTTLLGGDVLSTRAWAFQERLFSPRVLHFAEEQLFWECREEYYIEDGTPRKGNGKYPYPGVLTRILQGDSSLHESRSDVVRSWYRSVITDYTKGRLSFPSDKLPAISALARAFSIQIQSPYLAGMWLHDLPWGLCWWSFSHMRRSKPRVYRCPSWSWASLDIEVSFPPARTEDMQIHICIEEAKVQVKGEDPFGQVTGGWIKVTGRIRSFEYESPRTLWTSEGKVVAEWPYMDIEETSQCLYGLLVASVGMGFAWVLLLAAASPERTSFERKGLALLGRRLGSMLPVDLFSDCNEQTITLV